MTDVSMDDASLLPYGLGTPELVEFQPGYFVDKAIVNDLCALSAAAKASGFELRVESAYRSFEKQLSIWNRKARGELTLLSATGEPMERPTDEEELMYAILTWSALPGASRHHLGTDIDVVDGAACPEDYEVQLTPAECEGMFAKFHAFLTERMETDSAFGFSRVFVPGRGKIRPEGWHIAHLPTSRKRLEHFSLEVLRGIYERSDMECKQAVLANLPKLAEEYIYPYFV
jgi:LAS superfamily LD-carboxypeptidase LdcB